MLIPDARGGLLGGLVDDATLLATAAPDVDEVVEAYRALRTGPRGWIVGRLVVPVSLLEDLAGVLVRTMKGGDSPIPLVAVFDGSAASDASTASSFHATMDPAARIDIVRLAPSYGRGADTLTEGANATRAIHHDVLPMMSLPFTEDVRPILSAITAAEASLLHSVGLSLDILPSAPDASNLASSIRACSETSTPFTLQAPWFPPTTVVDPSTGRIIVGAMNLLASTLQTGATLAETIATLSDDEPSAFVTSFAGLSIRGRTIRPNRTISTDRSPLISLSAHDPAATIEGLGTLDLSA